MKLPAKVERLEEAELGGRALHLAIGMFDGVHLGHQAVIEAAVRSARRSGGVSGVLTFWPHPSHILRPEDPTRLIMDSQVKAAALWRLGVDLVIEKPFTVEYAQTPAEEFVGRLQEALPSLAAIYVGENFRFGRGRTGSLDLLMAWAAKLSIGVYSAPRIRHNGKDISSTRIREALKDGQVEEANELLGFSYFCHGEIVAGKKLGGQMGFPTLNFDWTPDLRPMAGVYVVEVRPDGSDRKFEGVANFGVRPTVGEDESPVLEVHLLEDCDLGHGDAATVEWLAFLRRERKFDGLDALKAQIGDDRKRAESFFARSRGRGEE